MGSTRSDSPERDRDRKRSSSSRKEEDRRDRDKGRDKSRDKDREKEDDEVERKSRHRHSDRDRDRKRDKKKRKREEDSDDDSRRGRNKSSKKKRKRRDDGKNKKKKKKRKRKSYSSSSSSSESSSSSSSSSSSESSSDETGDVQKTKKVVNKRLLEKLAAKGETLEEWRERKSQKRADRIAAKFGYTADDNPFNDPHLHETFKWKKRDEKIALTGGEGQQKQKQKPDHVFEEIEKVRKRRQDRELQFEELERIRAEESRMKELENYDEWARKEEEFHLAQQRQRSAIRLVEGREKPIDVLAKNLLLFGLSEEDRTSRGSVKYQERYNALNALESLEAELEEPQNLLKVLKLNELEELLVDIQAFMSLEREASAGHPGLRDDSTNAVLKYWEALKVVAQDEIKYLKTGGKDGSHAKTVTEVQTIFKGQSTDALIKMKTEVEQKLRDNATSGAGFGADASQDRDYWMLVLEQLTVHLAKMELSELHSKMLVCQLEKLEQKKEELSKKSAEQKEDGDQDKKEDADNRQMVPKNVAPDFGNLEEELGLTDEIDIHSKGYAWQDKYRPRKPRYFNRVKTGYDWNKYNQTHYDHDNPPPKIVQGYKFNIFYPDLIDPTKTPQYFLEPADSEEFCILRFHAGPPYEDVAFKIINREWNRSRKRGFRCTFERGVLSLYFNFTTHWYRR